jgi:hypothetical protein
MPSDTLREEINPFLRDASSYLASTKADEQERLRHVRNLRVAENRLVNEINERTTTYVTALEQRERTAIEARRREIHDDADFQRAAEKQKSCNQEFQNLRQVNDGGFPKNIHPVLYVIPLIMVGVAEWYVNFSTFAAMFIPVFAIAATIIVAAVFAWASHLHGAYLKQISEILHPSTEYRNVLGRKIALIIATVLLIAAFGTVVWLRWLVIAEQLGVDTAVEGPGTFGQQSSGRIWAKVTPTVVLNLLIWGLGTLYAWAMHEKVPDLRESYRKYLQASRAIDRKLKPFRAAERQIKAQGEREREKNQVMIKDYGALIEDIRSTLSRIQQMEPV